MRQFCAAAISIATIGLSNSPVEAAEFKRVEGRVTQFSSTAAKFTSSSCQRHRRIGSAIIRRADY